MGTDYIYTTGLASEHVAQSDRASTPGLCRMKRHRFAFRPLHDTFYQYRLPGLSSLSCYKVGLVFKKHIFNVPKSYLVFTQGHSCWKSALTCLEDGKAFERILQLTDTSAVVESRL